MKKYVIALYSNFYCSMEMREMYADSALAAGVGFLISKDEEAHADYVKNIVSYNGLQQYVFDQDCVIGVHEVTDF